MELTDFAWALRMLTMQEEKVARRGWNGKDMWVEMQIPDENSKMNLPYLYIKTADDNFVPWTPSQSDLMADDWFVVE